MNTEIKSRFVDALRSGEYKQGKGVLKRERSDKCEFCFMGVLSDLYAKAHPNKEHWEKDEAGKWWFKDTLFEEERNERRLLPNIVAEWAETGDNLVAKMERKYFLFGKEVIDQEVEFFELNDDGYTFEQLADLVEEHL